VAAIAREFGVGWRTAMGAVRERGTPLIEDPQRLAGAEALGVDETASPPLPGARRRHS
jgi:hypothetical protein